MKHKLKKILLLFLLTGTLFVSCEFDDYLKHDYNSEKGEKAHFKIEKVKFETFSKNTRLIGKLNNNKVLLKSVKNNKTITASDNSFYINTDYATYIEEENGLHSYTFYINRNIENIFLENLVISLEEDGSYKSHIVRYNISELEFQDMKNNIYVETNNRISLELINDDNFINGLSDKIIYTPCVTGSTTNWVCSEGNPHAPGAPDCYAESFSYVINVQWGLCASDDGLDDGVGSGGDGGSGGGSTTGSDSNYDGSDGDIHGNGSDAVNTAPMLELEEEEVIDKCKSLAKLIDPSKANIQSILDALNPNSGVEEGNSFQINTGNYSNPTIPNYGEASIHIPDAPNVYGAIHTHTPELGNMFSWGDLKTLERIYKNTLPENREDVVFMLKNSDGYIYAIKIDDFRLFRQFIHIKTQNLKNQYPNWNELRIQKALNEKTNFQSKYLNYQEKNVQESFLNFIENSGVSLYQLNQDSTTNEYSFTQISLPYNNQTADLTKTKCN